MIDLFARVISDYTSSVDSQVFGQNLFKPSYISGLGKYLIDDTGFNPTVSSNFDSSNTESTSIGYGIGRAIAGVNTTLIVKQQDFLFLGLDQFINTLINLQESSSSYGYFRVICLISDIPKEGTQAFSNNLSLFASLSPLLKISYNYFDFSLKNSLFSPNNFCLNFLSQEHIYTDSVIKSSIFQSYQLDSLGNCLVGTDSSPSWHIIIGFIPSDIIKSLIGDFIVFPHQLTIDNIILLVKNFNNDQLPKEIFLHSSDSSANLISQTIAFSIQSHFPQLKVSPIHYRTNCHSQFSLISQGVKS